MKYLYTTCIALMVMLNALGQQAPVTIPAFTFYSVQDAQPYNPDKLPTTGYIIFNYYDPGCGHCQKMASGIAKNYSRFSNSTIYFISINDKPYVEGFIEMYIPSLKSKKNVHFLHDKDITFIPKFNPTQYPSLYVYDAKTRKLIKHLDGEENVQKLLPYLK
ncbi:TlpA family protein disulfide reductase [Sphingobacterium sp. SYP-B4668]|uniref:TlpA family protein disulfide reductase n=1 Tax=Sphingobacterium sp. SYP-B4668 TaxID=2996035 RepID=UPI0022DE3224|nr:redoxin domain-containing protein [Sphingobacterium sp. SYP-B4668]